MNEIILFFFAWAFSNHFSSHLKFFRVFFLLLLYQGQRNGLILILGSWTLSLLVISALSYLICLLIYWMGFNKSTKPFKNRLLPVPYIYLCITCYSAPPLPHCARVTSILNLVFIIPLLFFFSSPTYRCTLALEHYKKYIILYIFFQEFLCLLSITLWGISQFLFFPTF